MSGRPAAPAAARTAPASALLTPALVFIGLVAAIVSSLGAPLIPRISTELHVPLSDAQWSLTAALLSGAVSAPIMGRLGDGPHRRTTLAAGLGLVMIGGIVAALAGSLSVLVAGRALQGVALGLVPLTMAAARDHLPGHKVPSAIALLSVSTAAGVGVGYPVSGLIAEGLGLSAAFWFGAIFSAAALATALAIVPSSRGAASVPLDVTGALLLTVALVALLLGIGQGNAWGWTSPRILGLFAVAVVLLAIWVKQQLRAPSPLVELRMLRRRAVLSADACAVVLGVAMYMYMSTVTEFVQTPRSAGYGFGASVVVAGLSLVPFSLLSFASSRALPWLARRVGQNAVLPLGSLTVAAAGAFFAIAHGALWEAFAMMAILGVAIGATFAALPGLIVRAVPEQETGSAMGFYQVVRYVGFSLGSALAASILASHTPAGQHLPNEAGYPLALWVAAGICVVAAALAWILPEQRPERLPADTALQRLMEEDAELGSAGLVGIEQAPGRVR